MFIYFLFFLLHTKTFLIHDSLYTTNTQRKNLVDASQCEEQYHKNGVMSRIVCCTLLLNNDNNNKNEELEHLYTPCMVRAQSKAHIIRIYITSPTILSVKYRFPLFFSRINILFAEINSPWNIFIGARHKHNFST